MKVKYSFKAKEKSFSALATGKDIRIKFKHAREICNAIQGMEAKKAVAYLEKVIKKQALVPFKKTKRQGGHKSALVGWPYGKYPIKAAKSVLDVLKNAVANAEFKGLDVDSCKIASALAQRGRKMFRLKPRGRHAVYRIHLTHVQIVLEEVPK